jgi:hypothetical protein
MLEDDWFCQPIGTKPSVHVHGLMMQSPMHSKPKPYGSQKQANQLVQCGLSAVAHMSSSRLSGIIDSGATSTSIGNRAEFVSLNTGGGAHKKLDGIAQDFWTSRAKAMWNAYCEWIVDPSYWVPKLGDTRLLSPKASIPQMVTAAQLSVMGTELQREPSIPTALLKS